MTHFEKIAAELKNRGLDAMLITSEPGEFYAMGFHGEGIALITPGKTWYYTDSRYIESAQGLIAGAEVGLHPKGGSYYTVVTKAVEAEFVPASSLLTELRQVKDADELAAMKEAQRITDEALLEILNFLKPGLTEQEVAARLTYIMARKGAERNSFDPIVACGPNGSKPHAVPGPDVIRKGQFVTMDFGCKVGGYCSDMTRTVAVGQPSEEMEFVYNTVLKAIEIHENPGFHTRNEKPIPAGALLSAEPGIYIPGKFGVRIEDVIMLTEGGCIDITHSPKQLIVL